MHAAWLPQHVGRASGHVYTRLSHVVQQDGNDDDEYDIQGRGKQQQGNKNQEEGRDVVCGLSLLRARGDTGAYDGNNGCNCIGMGAGGQGPAHKAELIVTKIFFFGK